MWSDLEEAATESAPSNTAIQPVVQAPMIRGRCDDGTWVNRAMTILREEEAYEDGDTEDTAVGEAQPLPPLYFGDIPVMRVPPYRLRLLGMRRLEQLMHNVVPPLVTPLNVQWDLVSHYFLRLALCCAPKPLRWRYINAEVCRLQKRLEALAGTPSLAAALVRGIPGARLLTRTELGDVELALAQLSVDKEQVYKGSMDQSARDIEEITSLSVEELQRRCATKPPPQDADAAVARNRYADQIKAVRAQEWLCVPFEYAARPLATRAVLCVGGFVYLSTQQVPAAVAAALRGVMENHMAGLATRRERALCDVVDAHLAKRLLGLQVMPVPAPLTRVCAEEQRVLAGLAPYSEQRLIALQAAFLVRRLMLQQQRQSLPRAVDQATLLGELVQCQDVLRRDAQATPLGGLIREMEAKAASLVHGRLQTVGDGVLKGELELDELWDAARTLLPPCLHRLYLTASHERHLRFDERGEFVVGMRVAGLQYEQMAELLRTLFLRYMKREEYERGNYDDGIKYLYGMKSKPPLAMWSCRTMQAKAVPQGYVHGCPFVTMQDAELTGLLRRRGLPVRDIEDVLKERRGRHDLRYSCACTRTLPESARGGAMGSPTRYMQRAVEARRRVRAQRKRDAAATAPVSTSVPAAAATSACVSIKTTSVTKGEGAPSPTQTAVAVATAATKKHRVVK